MYSFSYLEPVCCSMSSSNCCFLTCIQVSQKASQVAWYSHLFQTFPQFIVIHTVKGFGTVNKAEIDVFLELSCLTSLLKQKNLTHFIAIWKTATWKWFWQFSGRKLETDLINIHLWVRHCSRNENMEQLPSTRLQEAHILIAEKNAGQLSGEPGGKSWPSWGGRKVSASSVILKA